MDLHIEELPGGVTRAALSGRMDIEGAQAVDLKLNVLASSKKKLVIDVTEVSFLASMGLRTLFSCARTVAHKGGRLAIAGASEGVQKVLTTSGLDKMAPVSGSVGDAINALNG